MKDYVIKKGDMYTIVTLMFNTGEKYETTTLFVYGKQALKVIQEACKYMNILNIAPNMGETLVWKQATVTYIDNDNYTRQTTLQDFKYSNSIALAMLRYGYDGAYLITNVEQFERVYYKMRNLALEKRKVFLNSKQEETNQGETLQLEEVE